MSEWVMAKPAAAGEAWVRSEAVPTRTASCEEFPLVAEAAVRRSAIQVEQIRGRARGGLILCTDRQGLQRQRDGDEQDPSSKGDALQEHKRRQASRKRSLYIHIDGKKIPRDLMGISRRMQRERSG